jgi:hypothetical protein
MVHSAILQECTDPGPSPLPCSVSKKAQRGAEESPHKTLGGAPRLTWRLEIGSAATRTG